jgi:hypothetical protein
MLQESIARLPQPLRMTANQHSVAHRFVNMSGGAFLDTMRGCFSGVD